VIAQADAPFRRDVQDILNLQVRNVHGEMTPIGTMVDIHPSFGPDPVLRYNGYPAADLTGEADPSILSSAQMMRELAALTERTLPPGMHFEWTEMSYQQATQGNAALVVFPLAVLLVFLVLAQGAGAEVRQVMGITVFAGMLGTTLFGLLLPPVFYVALRQFSGRALVSHAPHANRQ